MKFFFTVFSNKIFFHAFDHGHRLSLSCCILMHRFFYGYSRHTLSLFFLIVFYPVIEELAFRGVIQEYIATKTKQYPSFFYLTVANILTSVLFVLMHFVHHTPIWAMLVFIPSLIFGYFKEQYKHIVPSIFLHMFYNICSLFLIVS